MKTLLQINSVVNTGSTGRIAEEIGQTAMAHGWNSYIAYGRNDRPSQSKLIRIGNDWDFKIHALKTRLFDRHGLASKYATKKLVRQIQKINPDVIHLHNLHGYYLNIEVLFNFLKKTNLPVVWTLHDCWPVTGHCAHFDLTGCEKWKTGCHHCPQKKAYPTSLFVDRSHKNFILKRELFNSINKLTLVPVSKWLRTIFQQSFLKAYPSYLINNGIDLSVFSPLLDSFKMRQKYNIGNSFLMIGVATAWSNQKGLNEFIELSQNKEWAIMLVGLPEKIKHILPSNIIALSRTENQQELASLYSAADVFLNPTYQDSFPTVNIEAMACGTPVVTYNTGGSPEVIDEHTGIIVKKREIEGLVAAIRQIKENGKEFYTEACVERARQCFKKEDRYKEYMELYETITRNNEA